MSKRVRLDACVHELVWERAAEAPDRIALSGVGGRLTYAELTAAASSYATELRDRLRPGAIVPVVLPPSFERVAVLLGLLRLGCAYAVVDPRWPEARLHGVLDRLGPHLVVGRIARPEATWEPQPARESGDVPAAPVTSRSACCVFFTSGTTGLPKAVVVPQRAVTRLFVPGTFVRLGPSSAVPQAAPLSWDAGAFELWGALITGATAVIVEESYLTPADLRRLVAEFGVDVAWLTSSLFNVLVSEDLDAFRGLRHVLTGGERLSVPHVRRFLEAHPQIELTNGYGPVESTVFATTHRIAPADCELDTGIPLGRPVPHTGVVVLDGDRRCASGEPGEICITGDGLALGYLDDPGETSRKFVEVELDGRPVRAYRTGDEGYLDETGLLHFSGRLDRQLKIRGHRVEPEAVEAALAAAPGVRSVVVLPERGDGGVAATVAFYTTTDGRPSAEIEDRAAQLPTYERPRALVHVERIPLTTTGKLDVDALLALRGLTPSEPGRRMPVSDAAVVAAIFGEALGGVDVDPDVRFEELGGSSLDAIRACARLEQRFSVAVPVSRLLEHGTAAAVASWLADTRDGTETPGRPRGSEPVALDPMQTAFLLDFLLEPTDLSGHCTLVWELRGRLDPALLERALAAVERRHEALRARYVGDDPPVAIVSAGPAIRLERAEASPSVDAAVDAVLAALAQAFELEDGLVWRAALASFGQDRHVFGIAVSHIGFDGWSESIFARDLSVAYREEAFASPAPTLADLRASYDERRRRAALDRQREHWLRALEGVPPLDVPEAPLGPHPLAQALVPVSDSTAEALRAGARRRGRSVLGPIVAAGAAALGRTFQADDFALGVPVARRGARELETAVGCLIDVVCIRVRPRLDGTLEESDLAAAESAVEAALRNQDLPIDEIVALVSPERTRRRLLYQTILTLQNNPRALLDLPGVEATQLDVPHLGTPTDLLSEVWLEPEGSARVVVTGHEAGMADDVAEAWSETLSSVVELAGAVAR